MRCVVTGCAGFIGSHLAERLIQEGWKVVGVDSLTSYYSPELKRRDLAALADIGRARRVLGWEPRVRLEEGLSRFIQWYEREMLT